MLKSAEKTGVNESSITLTVSAEAFEKAVNKVYNQQKGKINVPGFRKGKAPRSLIEKMYGADVFYNDALDLVFPDEYAAAVDEASLDVVGNPFDFEIKSIGKDGAELFFKVSTKPVITIDGYKGITAYKASEEVTDADVDAEIEKLRKQNARSVEVEGRAVENGDIAVIDFEGFVDGEAFDGGKAEAYELTIGSGSFIPGFEEQIIGHNAGDEFDVNVNFPEEYAEELAGKAAVFKIKLNAIRAEELPELDDELAKDVSEFDTLEELKADKRKTLAEQKADRVKSDFENGIYDKLAALVTEEIPQCMIDSAVDNMVNQFKYSVEQQGISFEQYMGYLGMTEDSIRDMYKDRAEKEVKIDLALEKIAELEGFEVSEDEINAEYARLAGVYGVDEDTVKKAIYADSIKKDLLGKKASELVINSAVATDKPEEPEAEEAKDEE